MTISIQEYFRQYASTIRAEQNLQWFKANEVNLPNFLGIMHGTINDFVKQYYKDFKLSELNNLFSSIYHEERMLGIKLAIKIFDSNKANQSIREEIIKICYENVDYFNQWDLIDTSSIYIFGYILNDVNSPYFIELSNSLSWQHIRILLVSQITSIRKEQKIDLALSLCEKYFSHKHDLIQKAVGWVLKEAYSHCPSQKNYILKFLSQNKTQMSKLTYRIANEKVDT